MAIKLISRNTTRQYSRIEKTTDHIAVCLYKCFQTPHKPYGRFRKLGKRGSRRQSRCVFSDHCRIDDRIDRCNYSAAKSRRKVFKIHRFNFPVQIIHIVFLPKHELSRFFVVAVSKRFAVISYPFKRSADI